jgi:hypothetical protein
MPTEAVQILSTVARELGISEDDLLKQGLRSFLERQLREVKAEIFEISGRYGISIAVFTRMYGACAWEALARQGKLRLIPYICSGTALDGHTLI